MANTTELKPLKNCPCCGGGAELRSKFDVKCTGCGLEINSLTPEEHWNRRVDHAPHEVEQSEYRRGVLDAAKVVGAYLHDDRSHLVNIVRALLTTEQEETSDAKV